MMGQAIGQNGINFNYEIKKVTVKPNDLIVIKTDALPSKTLHLCEELQKLYPNNKIAVMRNNINDLSTRDLNLFLTELQNTLHQRENEEYAVDIDEFDF